MRATIPKDAWDTLKKHFERGTLANKLFLKKQHFRKEMKEGTPVEVHLKEMKGITEKLASIGAPISEEDQVVTLLGSLPSNYSTLVTALEAHVDDVKLDFVQQALLHEEQKQKEHVGDNLPTGQQDSALVGAGALRNKSRKPPVCWSCNEVGHIQCYCPKEKYVTQQHKAKAAGEKEHDSDGEAVFPASDDLPKMGKWLVDSRASSHMTPQKELLVNYREFETPERVGLGDGRIVEAVGVGNIHLEMLFKLSNPKGAVMIDVLYVLKLTCNLFSVRAAANKGNVVKFTGSKCWIRN